LRLREQGNQVWFLIQQTEFCCRVISQKELKNNITSKSKLLVQRVFF
jgi:hypothetical protein